MNASPVITLQIPAPMFRRIKQMLEMSVLYPVCPILRVAVYLEMILHDRMPTTLFGSSVIGSFTKGSARGTRVAGTEIISSSDTWRTRS